MAEHESDNDTPEQAEPTVELTEEERAAKLAELDEAIAKYEGQKRWSDMIRSMVAKGDLLESPDERIETYAEAGRLYLDKSSNQAEAIKCFEKVLELDELNLEAIEQLKAMYERRRDWERLVRIRQRAATLMDPSDRIDEAVEIAQLATQRLRKPDICIELWRDVTAVDPDHPEALAALAQLYERSRDWQPLAEILDRQVDQIADEAALKQSLQKLGMIYADKLSDNEGAVRTFQRLLAIDPEDRRAQEQLKRRYIALRAWDELEDFYATTERWSELIRTFEREAEGKDTTPEERSELLFRAARLWEQKEEKPDRAARAYEKILAQDESNLAAAEALSPIYEKASDAKKLVRVYEIRLPHLETDAERIHLLREVAGLYEERLRNPAAAYERTLEAFALEPTLDVLQDDVRRLAEATKDWDRAVDAYASAIDGAADPIAQTELRLRLGEVLVQVDRVEDAIAHYRAVYDQEPENLVAIHALDELYRTTERYRELLGIFDRRIELELDPDARRQLAYGRAALLEESLGDPAAAIDAYQTILDEYGDGEVDAYAALDRLYQSEARWADLAATLERRIDLGPESTDEHAALTFRLAGVLAEHLGDRARALELYREVLTLSPEHAGAREALESFLADPELGPSAAAILEPVYEMSGAWEPLLRALEVLAEAADDPFTRLERLSKVGEVAGRELRDADRCFDAYARALRVVPDHEETLARLEHLAIEGDRFGALVDLLEQLAKGAQDPALGRQLWIKAAAIHDTQLQQVDRAVAAYREVLELHPEDPEVLDALDELYRRTERWKDLLGILRRKSDIAESAETQEDLLIAAALIHEERLEDPEAAIRVYADILELDPASPRALGALDRLYERLELWSDLADNIQRQLTLSDDPGESNALQLRLADLRETRMGAVDAAIEIYREVLEMTPGDESALGALERLIREPQHQVHIASILEPIYRDAAQFDKLIEVHEIQAQHADAPHMRVELLHRIADLQEVALNDYRRAFESYARALAEDPGDARTQEQLERLARATGGFDALAQVYEAQVVNLEDPLIASALHVKAASLREEEIHDLDGAIAHYNRVLALDPDHLDAASALERLYHLTERYEALAQILLKKAHILDPVDEKKEHLFRAAQLYEEFLERPAEAIGVYRRVLEVDPEDVGALDKLIEMHLRLEQWPELLAVYETKAGIVYDPEEKKRLYLEVGTVYETEVGDIDKAIDTYQRILEIDPDDLTAIQRLDALHQASGNWQELLSILEREADLAADPNEVISYRYRIADLWDHRLGDALRAVEGYRDILAADPDHRPTVDALERMIQAGKEPREGALVLEPIYTQTGEADKLVRVLEVQVREEEDPDRKVELLHRVAELQEVQLGRFREAFDAYARAVPLDPGHEVSLGHLERLAEELGTWQEVAGLYDREVERLRAEAAPETVIDLALRAARVHYVHLGDVHAAIERYRTVLAADEEHPQAIEALDQLYQDTEAWPDLAEILRKEVRLAASPDDVLNFQFRLGQLFQAHLDRTDDAIEQYREILGAAPDHPRALAALEGLFAEGVQQPRVGEILEPLYRMSESWDKLIGVHQVQLAHEADADERVHMMLRIAETAEDRGNDPQEALAWVQRALMEAPAHEQSFVEAERLAGTLGRWDQLAHSYASVLGRTANGETTRSTVVEGGKRLARIYLDELQDAARAVDTYLFVLGAEPHEAESLEALDRIYTEHGAHEALAAVLRKRVDAAEDAFDKVELAYRLGQLLENDLGQVPAAAEVYRELLDRYDAAHADSIRALENIYVEQQDWEALTAILERELEVALGDTGRADVAAKMAQVAAEHRGQPERGIELWREVLDLRGEDPEALNALGRLYAGQERWAELVGILEREASVVESDEDRIRIFADMGRIFYTRLEKERDAIDSWERVLDIDPNHTEALFALAEIRRAGGHHQELVDTLLRLREVGAATLDPAVFETVLMQLGELYETALEQPLDAVEVYQQAVEINPLNFGALDALERIHRREGNWVDCVEVLSQRVRALEDPQQKIAVLLGIGGVAETEMGEPDRGRGAFEAVLELDPLHAVAFDKLEALHRAAGRHEELVELYLNRIDATEDTDVAVDLYRRVATVQEEGLNDLPQALAALQLAWQTDFTKDATADHLERVAGLAGAWNEPLDLANQTLQELKESDDPDDRRIKIAICLRCAKWYGQELGHPEYAVPYYNQILALDPTNFAAMQSQADLYRSLGNWQMLAQLLGRMVEVVQKSNERAEVLNQMGELCENQLGMPEQAPTYYRQAMDAYPRHLGAIQNLERLTTQEGNWPEALRILQAKVDALTDPEEVVDAQLQVAEVLELRLDRPDDASAEYEAIRRANPAELRALKGLERLYARSERWQDLYDVLEGQFDLVATERDQIGILLRLAGMLEEEFIKPEQAAERLERVLDIDPSHTGALRGLERLYRHLLRWDDLIATLERHVSATPERQEKVECYAAMGDVYAVELDDPERAIDAFLNLLAIDEDNAPALVSLARLYEKREEYGPALDAMGRLSRLSQDTAQVIDLRYRMGRILDEHLGDRAGAVDAFRSALDVEPGHLPSLSAMRTIYLDEGDWLAASRVLEQEIEHQSVPRPKAVLLVELGRLYEERLEERDRAIASYEAAYAADPDNEDAALPLAEEYVAQDRHADAYPVLDTLVKRSAKREPADQHRLAVMLGDTSMRLGHNEAAIKALSRAHELDPQHLPTLLRLSEAYYRSADWANAFKFYQTLLVHHRDALGRDELTDVFYKLGVVKREQGDRRKAQNMFDKALEEDPAHRPTLEAMVDLHRAAGDWERVIHFKKDILELVEGEERLNLHDQIGDLYYDKLNDAERAIGAYREAAEIDPTSHKILHKMLLLHQKLRQWEDATGLIERISALDERSEAKAKYAYTIAVILRDELKDPERALAKFNEALDLDPNQLKAFEAINKILTSKKDWKQLERAFRKMIHRISGTDMVGSDLEYNLWHNLGVIYRDRLKHYESAVEAFKVATSKRPESATDHQILAELYTMLGPDKLQDAIDEHQWLLRQDPYRVQSYQALYRLYFDAKAYDKAWCLAATLTFLQKADAEQQRFYADNKPAGPIRPQSRLDNERWLKDLAHPTQDLLVSKVFGELWGPVLSLRIQADKDAGLNKKNEIDFANTTVSLARSFAFVAQVFGFPPPRLFLRDDLQGGLTHKPVYPLASLCGATLLSGFSPQDLFFLVGRHLADYRPEHRMRTLLSSTSELKTVLLAGLRIAGVMPAAEPAVEQAAQQLAAKMQPAQRDSLRSFAKRFMEAGARTDIKRWLQAVELTSCRAGFLVCNDLEVAARMVSQLGPAGPVDLPPKDKVKELVLFSVSEEYFTLREHLGIRIPLA
ncbi:MAG: tetratricopeptide repeat protein [Sandaracinaceae bacterium]